MKERCKVLFKEKRYFNHPIGLGFPGYSVFPLLVDVRLERIFQPCQGLLIGEYLMGEPLLVNAGFLIEYLCAEAGSNALLQGLVFSEKGSADAIAV